MAEMQVVTCHSLSGAANHLCDLLSRDGFHLHCSFIARHAFLHAFLAPAVSRPRILCLLSQRKYKSNPGSSNLPPDLRLIPTSKASHPRPT